MIPSLELQKIEKTYEIVMGNKKMNDTIEQKIW